MSLSILIVSAEAYPLAKTGGLADMVSAYANALFEAGAFPTLLIPAYRHVCQQIENLKYLTTLTDLPGGSANLLYGNMPNSQIPVILVECDTLYDRSDIYQNSNGDDWPDNAIRFAMLAAVGARIARKTFNFPEINRPNIIHCHDWHTGLLPLYLKLDLTHDVKSIFTIHNMAFQGNFPFSIAKDLKLPDSLIYSSSEDQSIELGKQLSFLKAGILFSDALTTVSQNYAEEIKSSRFGESLEKTICQNENKLTGIVNGIDLKVWNPANDPLLPFSYTPTDLQGKKMCKQTLQQFFNLIPDSSAPLIGICSRLTWQKMADHLVSAIDNLMQINTQAQVVILGKGNKAIEDKLLQCALKHPRRVSVAIGYDEQRGHLIIAGADMLLHPSRYEPCGLTAIYAMRYGTLPIASRVGGLVDSVYDLIDPDVIAGIDSESLHGKQEQGYQAVWSHSQLDNDVDDATCIDKIPSIHSYCQYSRLTNLHTFIEKPQTCLSFNYGQTSQSNHSHSQSNPSQKLATGFLFDGESAEVIVNAAMRAIHIYKNKNIWRCMQINGMQRDWSWDLSIKDYMSIYNRLKESAQLPHLMTDIQKNKAPNIDLTSKNKIKVSVKNNLNHPEAKQLAHNI